MGKKVLLFNKMPVFGNQGLPMQVSVLNACKIEVTSCPTILPFNYKGAEIDDYTELLEQYAPIFDAVLVGELYCGAYAEDILEYYKAHSSTILFVDPHTGPTSNITDTFRTNYISHIENLCRCADVIMPSYMSACVLADMEYVPVPSAEYLEGIAARLAAICNKFVIKGIITTEGNIMNLVYDNGMTKPLVSGLLPQNFTGSKDLFSAIFTAFMIHGKGMFQSAQYAQSFVIDAIARAIAQKRHTMEGPAFEDDLRKYSWKLNI